MKRSALPLALCALLAAAPLRAEDPVPTTPTTIVSQNLDMQSTDEETTFLFTGLVIVKGTNIALTCDRLEAITDRSKKDIAADQDKSALGQVGKFRRMLATGRVRIEQGDRVATCGRAEVLPGEEKITLTEDPMVRDGESTVVGESITLFRHQRRAVVTRARITLPPIKDLGFQKDAPPPPATPAAGTPASTSPTPATGSQTAPAVKFPAPATTPKPAAPAKTTP